MKHLPVQLKTIRQSLLILTIAGAALFPATSCEKAEPHHNTTYIWGVDYWDEVWPERTDNVARSADSTLVDFVFLENDGVSYRGRAPNSILENVNIIINSVKPENRHKIRGKGTIYGMGMNDNPKLIQDSITLANLGFKFANVRR